jgi:hypothetical protein
MAESAYLPGVTIQNSEVLDSPRHSVLVRVTHWIHTLSFLTLLLSGIAILLAPPRLYWGETGAVGTPSLIDLPLPFVLDVPIRGPGPLSSFSFRLGFRFYRLTLRPVRTFHPPLSQKLGA